MKLVEIKNSLAKLYYEPADFPLVLSDFLTIDDGNQKILSQVVSIESTSKDTTNCAILKFSLDLNADNTFSAYSGYTPPLDALVSKTKPSILEAIFSDSKSGIKLGKTTNTSDISLNVKPSLMENFLYIQSDRPDETKIITEKLLDFNLTKSAKTLYIDFEGTKLYENYGNVELGKDFKLPIDNDVLNYIYENDLTGLTVEQKTIVQDIILEIQDYINTLESGFIPFDTLLNVVNDIYESDKSTGIILFRNKLLKYKQYNIFASNDEEIKAIQKSIDENIITVLNVKNADINWQKETLNFLLNFIRSGYYLVFDTKDEVFDKQIFNNIYKAENIKPVISSRYDSEFASQLKSFAKNLILFKPDSQQRAFATYNSFLNKLCQGEFIVSGESTYYTPLIVKEIPQKIEQIQSVCAPPVSADNIFEDRHEVVVQEIEVDTADGSVREEAELVEEIPVSSQEPPLQSADETLQESLQTNPVELNEDEVLAELGGFEELPVLEEELHEENSESQNELKAIFEESLEQEIAKDVDKMFYADGVSEETTEETTEETETLETITEDSDDEKEQLPELQEDGGIDYSDMFSDEDLDLLDEFNSDEEETPLQEIPPAQEETYQKLPVYKTEIEEKIEANETVKIAEGNIVYHEKYGRGVVEQLISYGNKSFCSILFDNVGRRLLDPNLADLKQM